MLNRVEYDLKNDGSLCTGVLTFENGIITAQENGIKKEYRADSMKELVQRIYVGCGQLEAVPENGGDDMADCAVICRFSMARADEIGEFCKVVNHYINTGEMTEISSKGLRVCPKCGRHYAKALAVCLFCV